MFIIPLYYDKEGLFSDFIRYSLYLFAHLFEFKLEKAYPFITL